MVMLTDTGGGRDFEPVPPGQYAAICDMMVDLGMQDGGKWGPKHKLYFRFQIPEHRVQFERDGEEVDAPGIIGVQFTASLSEKANLRPFLEGWRGRAFTAEELKGFDPAQVAGVPAYLNVIHEPGNKNGKPVVYANIASIMPLPKAIPTPKLEGEVIIHDENHDSYDKLSKWLKEKIDNAVDDGADDFASPPQTQQRQQPAAFDTDLDDDVPF
jgi:hypothetical protein